MAILTNIRTNNRLSIVMETKHPSQAKRRMQVPSLFASTKSTAKINLAAIPIIDRPPNPRPLEILENTPEKHVIPLLLYMETTRPITDVQAITSEPTGEKLVPLLAAEIPDTGGQVRINMAGKLALSFPTRGLNNGIGRRLRSRRDLRLRDVVDGVQIEIIEERPRRGGR